MQVILNIEKTYLAFFLVALVVVVGVGIAVAQTAGVSHDYSEITLPSGAWPGLKADWNESQNMPADIADGDAVGPESGGLYGWCKEYYRGTTLRTPCESEPPASCSGNACVCGADYTRVQTGKFEWYIEWEDKPYSYVYYSCHKD